jgi:hypothetical protein
MRNAKIYRFTPKIKFPGIVFFMTFLSLSQWIREHGSHDPGQNHAEDCAKIKGLAFNLFQCSRPFFQDTSLYGLMVLFKTVETYPYLYKNFRKFFKFRS